MPAPNIDLHLIRCLDALVTEGHVTRASERMHMSQPAMSATLGRLRTLFGDPLLVRTERGMVVTQRALEIVQPLREALGLIDAAIEADPNFDPMRSAAEFQVEMSESVALVMMPSIIAHLRKAAPLMRLRLHPPELERVRQSLEDGEADLLISYLRAAPEGLRSTSLLRQKLWVIAAADHPSIRGTISMEQYLASPHARYVLSRTGSSTIENEIDAELKRMGLTRETGVSLPSALSSPAIVARSDLIATVPEEVARHFATALDLQVLTPPLALADVELSMYWHERMQNRAAHRWFRQTLVALAQARSAQPAFPAAPVRPA